MIWARLIRMIMRLTQPTTMMGTMDEESKLHIKASVLLTAHSKCDMSMQLQDVSLEEYDPISTGRKASINSEKFSKDLQQYSLRFSFQDGKIEEICPSSDESSWVLNVKRGILTVFQNSMDNLDKDQTLEEVDVGGKCPVVYETLGTSWGTTNIKKSKDFVKCTERQSADTSIQSTSYNHDSEIKSNPLIKGNQICTQSFSYQKLQKASCEEYLIFRPFSNKKSGAVTKASQTLTYNSHKKSSFAGDGKYYEAVRSKLIFNHEDEKTNEKRKYQDAEKALTSLCQKSVDDIRKEVPHLFNQYVYSLKQLRLPELKAIFSRSKEICQFNRKAEKYFTDALPSVGTEASVSMMIELIQKKKVSDIEADLWYTSFAFMAKPNLNMLNHVASVLSEPRQQAILGISSMVNTYCLSDSECQNKREVKRIITKLTELLTKDCQVSNAEESRQVLLALKGIGNAGNSGQAADILSKCAMNTKTNNDIRIAAIEAFRRLPCTVSRRTLMNQFRDSQEDTEVRIAAYLALMKCPTPAIIQSIKDDLNIEEVNQVGSFVWTHLTNMQETTDPCKKDIKELLRNVFLEKKFSTDARKFSRSFEKSLYSEKLNSGVHVDSNIIFTPQSYLPQSAMFNFTMDLFGHSLNLFEIGGKVEGFEHLVESFFGPNGFFPDKNIKEFLKKSRSKRSVYDNKIEEFVKLVSFIKFQKQENNFDKPEGSMYFKMFGNDLMYEDFKGLETLLSYTEKQINWIQILADLAKNRDIEYTKSMMFLDTTYTVPTSAGLPLHLSVNGTSTINLKLGGKLDLKNIFNKEIDINGHIKPSGAVEISAIMSVDAFYAQSGLKMVATMHSSTSLDGKIQMKDGKVLKTVLNVPNDKIEILDVQTSMFLIHQDVEYPQKGIEEERTEMNKCTGDLISTITGMELCGELQFPNASLKYDSPYFPMTGPTKFSIYLKKTDLKMKSYKFDATYENTEDKKAALLSFDTPGSDVDREMTVEMSMDKKDHKVTLRLRTPMKKLGMSGKFPLVFNKELHKKAEMTFTIDDIEKLAMIAELDIQNKADSTRYTPKIEFRTPGMKTIKLSGYGFIQPSKRLLVDINVDNLTEKTLEFKVDVNKQGEGRYAVDSRLSSHVLSAKVRGNVQTRERGTTTNMNIDYSVLQGKYEKMKIGTKFQDLSASSLRKLKIGVTLDMSALPEYNTQLNWETQMAKGHIENTLKIKVSGEVKFAYPGREMKVEGKLNKSKKNQYVAIMSAQWQKGKKVTANAEYTNKSKSQRTSPHLGNRCYYAN
ncbi:Apolipophorin [Nymphon striatum]|nr:Apolipophorin [Nymphon striatum]